MNLFRGDNLEHLQFEPSNSIDAVVTDPPYGLSFMGKKWDYDVPSVELWREVFRVLKPGGHLLSFGGTRTYHRMVVNIEDAGFEIRDQIMWLYGSGFPKSMNVGKKHSEWQGWGTALKPANEPIVLARKPIEKGLTVAENVLKWGTGAINVDAGRIETTGADKEKHLAEWDRVQSKQKGPVEFKGLAEVKLNNYAKEGRWPANVLFDEEAAAALDEQSGPTKGGGKTKVKTDTKQMFGMSGHVNVDYPDSGGASRFFYVAKTSKRERNAGLEGMPEKVNDFQRQSSGLASTTIDGVRQKGNRGQPNSNHHPTVKPIKLMEYLIKLITPPGGVVLDPFMGSGSTGCAAKNLKFRFIGIELEKEYFEIAKRRIEHHQKGKRA